MIILLDLNYMLVANSEWKGSPFIFQIGHEEYRKELIELVKPHYVILVTARPEKYKDYTLKSIQGKTGWAPEGAYFNVKGLSPAIHKANLLNNQLEWVLGEDAIAIESNPKTIEMYMKRGIFCLTLGKSFVDAKKGFTELTEDVRE